MSSSTLKSRMLLISLLTTRLLAQGSEPARGIVAASTSTSIYGSETDFTQPPVPATIPAVVGVEGAVK
jgi:hypothetical protein